MAETRNIRWILGVFGLFLPLLGLLGMCQLFAWIPDFRGSAALSILVALGAFVATGVATLGASLPWRARCALAAVAWSLLGAQLAGILGWAYFSMELGTAQPEIKVTASWMAPLESEWSRQSPGKDYSIRVASDRRRCGNDSLRFELRPGECYADFLGRTSHRSEVNARDFPPLGGTRWYAFSLLLPDDFPVEDNRLVLVQWHGADKKYLAEPSRSPTLAFRYSRGVFSITMRHTNERLVRVPASVPSETLYEAKGFELGKWHDFLVGATWSHRADGRVEVWWNSQRIVRYAGPVGYNDDFGPYFKFGIYRDDTDKTYVVYFSEVRVSSQAPPLPNGSVEANRRHTTFTPSEPDA